MNELSPFSRRRRSRAPWWLAAAVLALLFPDTPGFAARTNRFTAAIISKSEPSTNLTRVTWRPPGRQASYLRPVVRSNITQQVLCAYDIDSAREVVLFDPAPRNGDTNRPKLSLSGYQWTPDGEAILVTGGNDLWLVLIRTGEPRRLTRDSETEEHPLLAPDGRRVAFVKRGNLFMVDVESSRVRQLTADGGDLVLNGRLDWVYGEEFVHLTGSGRSFEWSPDSRRLVYLRLDQSPVPEHPITDFLSTHPAVRPQRYPKAGDSNAIPSVRVVRVDQSRPTSRRMPLPAGAEYVLPEFSWTPDAESVAVMTLNRAQNELKVHLWNPARGQIRLLLSEREESWINVFEPPRFLRDGRRFLWASERDGWYHCHLYQMDGTLLHAVTRGAWQIEADHSQFGSVRPYEIDPAEEWIYFSATKPDPRERHLHRVRIDGSVEERLSGSHGTHFQKLSPDGRHLLVLSSSVERPQATRLLRADGSPVATLEQRADRWRDYATANAEFHEVTAPDGAKLYGQLIKPPDFDPSRRHPVIVYVYGGPHAQVIRNQWPAVSARHHLLAQEGFVIWSLDNRGSWGRGKAWESAIHRNLGTNELADQLAGVAYLASLPFVDTNRLGIWGWSYGGYMTLYALTHAPDVFKCGVAGAPVTDWKFYDTIYTERYMGTPAGNKAGYLTSSPLAAATRLKARLLLIHGTSDDNVHLQNTLNFVDALVKAGKPHELQIQPGQMHGFGGEAANRFLNEQILDFFKRWL